MNSKGQSLLFAIIGAVMIFMAGMLFLNHVMDDVTLSRTVGFNCDDSTISDGTKLTCLGIDLVIPILIISIVSLSGGLIINRFVI